MYKPKKFHPKGGCAAQKWRLRMNLSDAIWEQAEVIRSGFCPVLNIQWLMVTLIVTKLSFEHQITAPSCSKRQICQVVQSPVFTTASIIRN